MSDRGYPPCANPACEHTLCWLDRQMDECPACGTSIPPELRVDNDFKPLPVIRPPDQYGYRSWSPEERAEYDRMYDR